MVRHAGTAHCQVSVDRGREELSIEVTDDGHGGTAPESRARAAPDTASPACASASGCCTASSARARGPAAASASRPGCPCRRRSDDRAAGLTRGADPTRCPEPRPSASCSPTTSRWSGPGCGCSSPTPRSGGRRRGRHGRAGGPARQGTARRRGDGHPDAGDGRHRGHPDDHRGVRTETRVLVLTTFDDDDYVYAALRAGASGFLVKDMALEDILAAIRVVAAGDALIAPSVTRRLIEEFAGRPEPEPPTTPRRTADGVTEREREVLTLVGRGLSNTEIAAEPVDQRGHREGARGAAVDQARRPRPGPPGDHRLRDGSGSAAPLRSAPRAIPEGRVRYRYGRTSAPTGPVRPASGGRTGGGRRRGNRTGGRGCRGRRTAGRRARPSAGRVPRPW